MLTMLSFKQSVCFYPYNFHSYSFYVLSKQVPAKTRSTGERIPQPPGSSHVPVVKTEPVEDFPSKIHFSRPIVISSDSDDAPTPKAKPTKGKTGPPSRASGKQKSSYTSEGRNHDDDMRSDASADNAIDG